MSRMDYLNFLPKLEKILRGNELKLKDLAPTFLNHPSFKVTDYHFIIIEANTLTNLKIEFISCFDSCFKLEYPLPYSCYIIIIQKLNFHYF
jgi:hypothetical protein